MLVKKSITKRKFSFFSTHYKNIFPLVSILAVCIVMLLTVFIVQEKTNTQQEAATLRSAPKYYGYPGPYGYPVPCNSCGSCGGTCVVSNICKTNCNSCRSGLGCGTGKSCCF